MRTPSSKHSYDVVVVGAGPNGLAAAITAAEAGLRVLLLEANARVGGALASAELTLPGFVHDLGSAIHPFGVASPFFRRLPLEAYGLRWVHPAAAAAHPLDREPAVLLERDIDATARGLAGGGIDGTDGGTDGGADAAAYRRLLTPLTDRWEALAEDVLRPLIGVPRHPLALARFGLAALQPAALLTRTRFRGPRARALLAGIAAHANLPLSALATAAPLLVLTILAHRVGWPFPAGGAQRFAEALRAHFQALGGELATGVRITNLAELPPGRVTLLDLTPPQLLRLAGDALPGGYRRWLQRYRPAPAVFKLDWALDAAIPWRDADCARAATVHLGGTLEEIAAAEAAVAQGRLPERPYVLLAQHSPFDPLRAPTGKHTCWAYCHLPRAAAAAPSADLEARVAQRIEAQIERFAPGFRERVLARHASPPRELERQNANLVGGDISAGAHTLWQTLARPVPSPTPYATPLAGVYLCSAATPPGVGVHGMCGHNAASLALRREFGIPAGPLGTRTRAQPHRRPPARP